MGLEYNEKVLSIHRPFILWVVSALVSAAKFKSGRIVPAKYNYIVCAAELQALFECVPLSNVVPV
jgi:hypothetical protein